LPEAHKQRRAQRELILDRFGLLVGATLFGVVAERERRRHAEHAKAAHGVAETAPNIGSRARARATAELRQREQEHERTRSLVSEAAFEPRHEAAYEHAPCRRKTSSVLRRATLARAL
jgi:hypothetical protein